MARLSDFFTVPTYQPPTQVRWLGMSVVMFGLGTYYMEHVYKSQPWTPSDLTYHIAIFVVGLFLTMPAQTLSLISALPVPAWLARSSAPDAPSEPESVSAPVVPDAPVPESPHVETKTP